MGHVRIANIFEGEANEKCGAANQDL